MTPYAMAALALVLFIPGAVLMARWMRNTRPWKVAVFLPAVLVYSLAVTAVCLSLGDRLDVAKVGTSAEAVQRCGDYVRQQAHAEQVLSAKPEQGYQVWTVTGQASAAATTWDYRCQVRVPGWGLVQLTWADTSGALHAG